MTTTRTKRALLIGTVALTGFGIWSYAEIKKILQESIKFAKLKTQQISFKQVTFDLFVNITNPSRIPLTIISQQYQAYINKVPVAQGKSQLQQKIHPNSTTTLNMFVSLQPYKLGTELLKLYIAKTQINVTILVKIKIQIAFFKFSVPYVYQTTLATLLKK